MDNFILIGSGSQIAHYYPDYYQKIPARWWFSNKMPLDKSDFDIVILAFGENRTYLANGELPLDEFIRVNVDLTLQGIKRFLNISKKIVVFGTSELWSKSNGPINVNNPLNFCSNSYNISKSILVSELRRRRYGNVQIVHPFNFNTTNRGDQFLFGKVYESIFNRRKIVLGDTYFERDLVSAIDVVEATTEAHSLQERLVGSGMLYSVNKLIRALYDHAMIEYDQYVIENLEFLSSRRLYSYYAEQGAGSDTVDWMIKDLTNALSLRGLSWRGY